MINKLQAFRAWNCEDPAHMIIVADSHLREAKDAAAKFLHCPAWDIRSRITSQRHIRRMRAPGVAWVVNLAPEQPRRYPATIQTLQPTQALQSPERSREGVGNLLRLVAICGVIDSL